jgi:type II secretory pathway pseudopilin PulG
MDSSGIIVVVVFVVVIAGLVLWIASISRRAKQSSAASDQRIAQQLQAAMVDLPPTKPFADETAAERNANIISDGTDPALDPEDASPAALKETRLAELGDLHARGLISDDELATARAKILAE